jgi:hypothetical protein
MTVRYVLPLALLLAACSAEDGARDRQLDELTLGRINDVLNITQCAFNGTGTAPETFDAARSVEGWLADDRTLQACNLGTTPNQIPVQEGNRPAAPGDVSYKSASATMIQICGNFRQPSAARGDCKGLCGGVRQPYAQFEQARPAAGPFCYELELLKGQRTDVGMPAAPVQ